MHIRVYVCMYILHVYFTCFFYLLWLFILLHYTFILSIFVSEIPLEKNLANQMILHISCAKFAYSAPNIGRSQSPMRQTGVSKK